MKSLVLVFVLVVGACSAPQQAASERDPAVAEVQPAVTANPAGDVESAVTVKPAGESKPAVTTKPAKSPKPASAPTGWCYVTDGRGGSAAKTRHYCYGVFEACEEQRSRNRRALRQPCIERETWCYMRRDNRGQERGYSCQPHKSACKSMADLQSLLDRSNATRCEPRTPR